jgi:hypothetical protein
LASAILVNVLLALLKIIVVVNVLIFYWSDIQNMYMRHGHFMYSSETHKKSHKTCR